MKLVLDTSALYLQKNNNPPDHDMIKCIHTRLDDISPNFAMKVFLKSFYLLVVHNELQSCMRV
jgi:hypothetical protein